MALKTNGLEEVHEESDVYDSKIDLQATAFIVKKYKQLLKGKRPDLKKNFQNNKFDKKAPIKSNPP